MSRRKQAKPIRHLEDGTIINLNGKNNKPYFILKRNYDYLSLIYLTYQYENEFIKYFFQKSITQRKFQYVVKKSCLYRNEFDMIKMLKLL